VLFAQRLCSECQQSFELRRNDEIGDEEARRVVAQINKQMSKSGSAVQRIEPFRHCYDNRIL
jgi:hypothetical protein